jgi:1-deoxy-D-xylulose-5-phosphate synthase
VFDRAGITGDDGPSHHGVLDLALALTIPGMTIFAPSSAQEVPVMLEEALRLTGPAALRWPKGPARQVAAGEVGSGLKARRVRAGSEVCLLAVGRMAQAAEDAADALARHGVTATVWDIRVAAPIGRLPSVVVLGVPSEYIPHGNAAAILARLGLDGAGIANTIFAAVGLAGTEPKDPSLGGVQHDRAPNPKTQTVPE